jgi:hypothetical protein
MDKEKYDLEAKSIGTIIYDYALYIKQREDNLILTVLFVAVFMFLAYLIGYITAKGFL